MLRSVLRNAPTILLLTLWSCGAHREAPTPSMAPEHYGEAAPESGEAYDMAEADEDAAISLDDAPKRADFEERMISREPPASRSRRGAPAMKKSKQKPGGKKVTTWKRSTVLPNTSRLAIGDDEYLPLSGMQVSVRIDGFRARVILDSFFYNDHDRQYEGTFQLRLPTGASPYFFAFGETVYASDNIQAAYFEQDQVRKQGFEPQQIMQARQGSWSKPREARMVTKEKAAHAYRETVRRRVDPALMEWSGAGIFNARVFPLAGKKMHRIVIGYDVDLQAAGNDLEYRFDVPKTKSDRMIDINIAEITGIKMEVAPASQAQRGGGRRLYRFHNPTAEAITVRLVDPGPMLLTGADPQTGAYFAADWVPDLPKAEAKGASRAIFMVDTSLSSNPDRFNVWVKLLRAVLDNNRGQLKEFAVLFFDIEASWWRAGFSPNTPANVEALMQHLGKLSLEGATDVGAALREAGRPSWIGKASRSTPWDLFLLSDGAVTWGQADLHSLSAVLAKGGAGALFGYTTGMAGTNMRALNHLAREGGGAIFTVAGEAEIEKASKAHRFRPWQIDKIEVRGGSDLLLGGRPNAVFPGQRLRLVGRGDLQPGITVSLTLQRDGKQHVVSTKVKRGLRSELTARIYGQVATEQLEEFKTATEEYSKAYGCHFRVTGKTCSLLMLESEADYERFNIKPEDLAYVVKNKPASKIVSDVLASIGDSLSDPKAAFLTWLGKMTKMPGFQLTIPPALKIALDKMPRAAFAVVVPPLRIKERRWTAVGKTARKQLSSRKLEYDTFVKEAERRRAKWGTADGLRALSSLIENKPGDAVLARDVGFTAMAWGLRGQAYYIFRRVADAKPYEPQTYRALATVLAEMGYTDHALAYYEVGMAGSWDSRFGEYRRILALDYLRFLRRIDKGELKTSVPDFVRRTLTTVAGEFEIKEADLLVSITWNTDGTDVDLHVIEPGGEECFYSHPTTKQGGRITQDVTQGYGPEMYMLQRAKPGSYKVKVKYFSSDSNRASARTKIYATLYENWGTPREKRTQKVVTLKYGKEMHDIAVLNISQ